MPRARKEGAVAAPVAAEEAPGQVVEEVAIEELVKHPDPVPGDDGDALARIAQSFRDRFPEDWENIRLCPLQHGLEAMADILRGR